MPHSSSEGKSWIVERVTALQPRQVLDIGAGAGTYADLLRPRLPDARFTAVEVFEPYVGRFNLRAKYNEILIGNALDLVLPYADVVILGDVLEHLVYREALELWAQARVAATKAVFLSLPIVPYPQGAVDGNEHEAHLHTWSFRSVVNNLPGICGSHAGSEIGVFQGAPFGRLPSSKVILP